MQILLGTIGDAQYSPTTYQFADETSVETPYFIHALASYLQPARVMVLLTEEAHILHWDDLKPLLEETGTQDIEAVDIPRGASEEELWEIFDRITASLPDDCEVVLDVTLGLRSHSMLMLISVAYLRLVKHQVRVKQVYYGASDAVDYTEPVKPVFDLSQFVHLMDWINAVELFTRTGHGTDLAELLQRGIDDGLGHHILPSARLKTLSLHLAQLSHAIDLIRSEEILNIAATFTDEIKAAEDEIPVWATPFKLVLAQLRKEFGKLALHDTRSRSAGPRIVDRLLHLVEWYYQNGRMTSAIILAGEWLVCWHIIQENRTVSSLYHRDVREATRKQMYDYLHRRHDDNWYEIGTLAAKLSELRNDIAHAGMRDDAKSHAQLEREIGPVIERLKAIR